MSFIINNTTNNRLLLLPSTHHHYLDYQQNNPVNEFDNVSLKQLLKADLTQLRRESFSHNYYSHNYTYNEYGRRSSQFSSVSSVASSIVSSDGFTSAASISEDDGFSSDEEEFNKEPVITKEASQSIEDLTDREPKISHSEQVQTEKSSSPEPEELLKHEPEAIPQKDIKEPQIPMKRSADASEEEEVEEDGDNDETPAKPKRQRVGPSCDLCRSKKIKCDAHVEIMELDVDCVKLKLSKKSEIQDKTTINKYLKSSELHEDFKLVYSNNKIIKFKSCSYCIAKGKPCVYKRGYTKDDILRYNMAHNIKKKKKTKRR